MKPEELKLFELMKIDEAAGTIYFQDRRMLIFDADAIGLLRKELIESLGLDNARRLLKRFSYARGYLDAMTLKHNFTWQDDHDWIQGGLKLHALEGIVTTRPIKFQIDKVHNIYDSEVEYLNSYEVEQHRIHIGPSDIPVCWTITGYASGYASAVFGKEVYVYERECIGKGNHRCIGVGKALVMRDPDIEKLFDQFQGKCLQSEMQQLMDQLAERSQTFTKQQEQVAQLEQQVIQLQQLLETEYDLTEMIGASPTFHEVLKNVERVAGTDATVLITGETGTGKELLARAIHTRSKRSKKPMISLNCAALPTGLVESELFGHEKGAFTGADQRKLGRFELADGATIFLDEVGELPLETQSKLLRVLQEGEFERLGSSRTIKVDVRVIAATNQPLERLVAEGKYRSDLFYRLNVFPITIPPLRARGNDLILLAYYFAQKFRTRFKKKINSINEESLERLRHYQFPGNIRELEHMIERAVLINEGEELIIDVPVNSVKLPSEEIPSNGQSLRLVTMVEMERDYIAEVVEHTRGQIEGKGGAAEILLLPSSTLRSRMKKLGLR